MIEYTHSAKAEYISEIQLKIRQIIKYWFIMEISYNTMKIAIKKTLDDLKYPELKEELKRYSNIYLSRYLAALGLSITFLVEAVRRNPSIQNPQQLLQVKNPRFTPLFTQRGDKGLMSPEYQRRLQKATQELEMPPNRLSFEAEIQTRRDIQMEQLQEARKAGKLVMVSSHADCSDLCAPYQGRIFSLDNTEGFTGDGRFYEPIERAIGKDKLTHRWCRHSFKPYRPNEFPPHVSNKELQIERDLTTRQRQLERKTRDSYSNYKK